jgi:DNA ligase (NAD+)
MQLEEDIKRYAKSYYEGDAEISDDEFDAMVEKLRASNQESELLKVPGWGYYQSGQKVKHLSPLYTIDEKIKDHSIAVKKLRDSDGPTLIQPKYDGISATAYYRNGVRVATITRGDGIEGYNIEGKFNAKKLEGLIGSEASADVRMEICMSIENWKKYYDEAENPSPRNLVAGICNKDNPEPWEVGIADPVVLDITYLPGSRSLPLRDGMGEIEFARILNPEDMIDALPSCKYPTDGYVIKSYGPDSDEGKRMKIKSIWAFKPTSQVVETTVRSISWQKGSTGKMTPVLNVDEVLVSGAYVSRVTANSFRFLQSHKAGVGSVIKIKRSGEVIPCLVEVVTPSEVYNIPEGCVEKGAHLYQGIEVRIFERLVESMANSVLNFGGSLVQKIKDHYFVEGVGDWSAFYDMRTQYRFENHFTDHEKDLIKQGFGAIDNMAYYSELIARCNLPDIGDSAIGKIVRGEKLPSHSNASWEKYGRRVEEARSLLQNSLGLVLLDQDPRIGVTVGLKGKVAITGKHEMSRKEMEAKLVEMGYEPVGSVGKDTAYLIIADVNSTSSKAVGARKLGVKLIGSLDELNG